MQEIIRKALLGKLVSHCYTLLYVCKYNNPGVIVNCDNCTIVLWQYQPMFDLHLSETDYQKSMVVTWF